MKLHACQKSHTKNAHRMRCERLPPFPLHVFLRPRPSCLPPLTAPGRSVACGIVHCHVAHSVQIYHAHNFCQSSLCFLKEVATSQISHKMSFTCSAANSFEPSWREISNVLFGAECHFLSKSASVAVGTSLPSDVLQGKGRYFGALDLLRRQGALKIHFDEFWNSSDCSALLDLKWLKQSGVKTKSLRGNFSYLQQALPHRAHPIVQMAQESKKSIRTTLGELITESDETFKTICAPYHGLGPEDRESLFLTIAHARLSVRFPYLSSVALDALKCDVLSCARQIKFKSQEHPWEPSIVADGQDSILRKMLEMCEKRSQSRVNTLNNRPRLRDNTRAYRECHAVVVLNNVSGISARQQVTSAAFVSFVDAVGSIDHRSRNTLWGAGIISPWLYFMSFGSVFCCHIEDYAFGSANTVIAPCASQSWVVWYSVPRQDIGALHQYLHDLLGEEYSLDCLEQRKLWIDPSSVSAWRGSKGERVQIFRHLQGPSEYIVTDYGSVHWGVNLGVGWKAAVNFAYSEWRSAAEELHLVYRTLELKTGQRRHYRSVPIFEKN